MFKFHFKEWENKVKTLSLSQKGPCFHATVVALLYECFQAFWCIGCNLSKSSSPYSLSPRTPHTEHLFLPWNLYHNTQGIRTLSGWIVEGLLWNLHHSRTLWLHPINLSILSLQNHHIFSRKIFLLCWGVMNLQ